MGVLGCIYKVVVVGCGGVWWGVVGCGQVWFLNAPSYSNLRVGTIAILKASPIKKLRK